MITCNFFFFWTNLNHVTHFTYKNLVRSAPIEGLTEQEQSEIRDLITRMLPMHQRIDQLLPVFLALTNNHEATKRLIQLKYIFQDQLDALPRGVFVLTVADTIKLKEQF